MPKKFTATNQPWEYKNGTASTVFTETGWKDYFTNTDPDADKVGLVAPNGCNPTSCKVMNADCTKDWDMTAENGFTFDSSSYKLSYTQTKVEGFDYNICMQCSNSHMTA